MLGWSPADQCESAPGPTSVMYVREVDQPRVEGGVGEGNLVAVVAVGRTFHAVEQCLDLG